MATKLTHDRADKAQHDQASVYDDRTRPANMREAESAEQVSSYAMTPGWTCDACEPGNAPRTISEDVLGDLAAFARASIEVALDATPGSDSDYLYESHGVLATDTNTDDPREIFITTDQGRRYAISVHARELGSDAPREQSASTDPRAITENEARLQARGSTCPKCGSDGSYNASEFGDESVYQDASCINGHAWREISTLTHVVAITEEHGEEIGTPVAYPVEPYTERA